MKSMLVLALGLMTSSAFAVNMDCVGTTVIFDNQGNATSTETILQKVENDKGYAYYYGESSVFKFYADHNVSEKYISLEILDKKDTIVINNPRMAVARFNVSIGGYWKTFFTSLNCTPAKF